MRLRRGTPEVHLVTQARRSRFDDIAARQRRYLISMAIRTGAVLLAFFAPLPVWGRVLAVVLGLVLPWAAVTNANTGPLPETRMRAFDPDVAQRELPPDDAGRAGSGEQRAS